MFGTSWRVYFPHHVLRWFQERLQTVQQVCSSLLRSAIGSPYCHQYISYDDRRHQEATQSQNHCKYPVATVLLVNFQAQV